MVRRIIGRRRRVTRQAAPVSKGITPAGSTFSREALERGAAISAADEFPTLTLDSVTHKAYQATYSSGPDFPDFYDEDDIAWVMAWVRIRSWVDWYRNRPSGGTITMAVKPYSEPAPLESLGVPMGRGVANPAWPIHSTDPRACLVSYLDVTGQLHGQPFQRFGAPRGSSDWIRKQSRYHIGHDCIANAGDLVVAPEAGVVGNFRDFYAGTKALYLLADSGITLVLGEIEPGSQSEFNVAIGTRVTQGQSVARVGTFEMGKELPFHMIHFEIFEGHRDRSLNWYDGNLRPKDLRNPTDYLLRAACSTPPMGFSAEPPQELAELGLEVMADDSPAFPH